VALMAASAGQAATPAGIDKPLTDVPGDPANGFKVALDFNRGDCDACHKLPVPGRPADSFGDIGPDLSHVGAELTVPQLRQRIVDPKALDPETLMPAFHSVDGLTRVDPKFAGKPILTDQEVEDVVAYLATLK
jgi:sulfur-oxidizing protein SoxX